MLVESNPETVVASCLLRHRKPVTREATALVAVPIKEPKPYLPTVGILGVPKNSADFVLGGSQGNLDRSRITPMGHDSASFGLRNFRKRSFTQQDERTRESDNAHNH
jgi:hypothetical protein